MLTSSVATWFAPHTADTAPAAARGRLAASGRQFGFVPSPVARAAGSPTLLEHLLAGFAVFDRSSLSHVEREVLAMTVAHEVGCHYCMAMHSALGAAAPDVAPLVDALRAGQPLPDPKLDALAALARALVRDHARVDPALWERFAAAGYEERHGLDVVLGVGVYLLSTFTNIVTRSELDPPFVPFAWHR